MIKYVTIILSISFAAHSTLYWVDDNGAASWINAQSESPLLGSACASLATANSNASAGDTVYMRGGTYTVTTATGGISPDYSGTSGSKIVFSAYNSEEVILSGTAGYTGRNARGIDINGVDYIVVTGITAENMSSGIIIDDGHYNEISYCEISFRDPWADVQISGRADNDVGNYYQSSTVLYDVAENLSAGAYRRVFNVTDKSAMNSVSATSNTLTATSASLNGGTNNYWSNNDSFQVTWSYPYNPGPNDIGNGSTHNWIHHNTIHGCGGFIEYQDGSPLFQIGPDLSSSDANNYNTIEDNHIYHGGHHVFGLNAGKFSVIRRNYFHNESWFHDSLYSGNCTSMGGCGYRVLSSTADDSSLGGHHLIEGNNIGYGAQYGGGHLVDAGGAGSGVTLSTSCNIFRRNSVFANVMQGIRFAATVGDPGTNNHVYNNTFLYNGYNDSSYGVADLDDIDGNQLGDNYRTAVSYGTSSDVYNNVLINNLMHDSWASTNNQSTSSYYPQIYMWTSNNRNNNTIYPNYADTTTYLVSGSPLSNTADPMFIDEDLTTVMGAGVYENFVLLKPDLNLQAASPCIDAGTYLTQANGSGTDDDTLIVDDAWYFQYGQLGSDLARATLNADWIAIGTVTDTVAIDSIDYANNKIILAAMMTWSDNANIYLYRDSGGNRVLYSTAPDYGAFEYNGEIAGDPVINVNITIER